MNSAVPIRLLAYVLLAVVGCAREQQRDQPPATIAEVRRIAAELLGVPQQQIDLNVPLGRHDAPLDDLDLVELVMELEDHFQIAIPDEELVREAGADDLTGMRSRLTLTSLATIVDRIRAKSY